MGQLIFNGVSTADMGLVIQAPPSYEFPQKDYGISHIEGKSGDIVIDKGSYKNVNRTYYLASAFKPGTSFVTNASEIISWLHSASGYARLEDSYEPEYYRMAAFNDSGSLLNIYDKATAYEATFNCKPQRYLKSGDENIDYSIGYLSIINPTKQIALPNITFSGNSGTLTITIYAGTHSSYTHRTIVTIASTASSGVINSELQDCYNGSTYINNKVTLGGDGGFPALYPGMNEISCSASSGSPTITITPRWWTL